MLIILKLANYNLLIAFSVTYSVVRYQEVVIDEMCAYLKNLKTFIKHKTEDFKLPVYKDHKLK